MNVNFQLALSPSWDVTQGVTPGDQLGKYEQAEETKQNVPSPQPQSSTEKQQKSFYFLT